MPFPLATPKLHLNGISDNMKQARRSQKVDASSKIQEHIRNKFILESLDLSTAGANYQQIGRKQVNLLMKLT